MTEEEAAPAAGLFDKKKKKKKKVREEETSADPEAEPGHADDFGGEDDGGPAVPPSHAECASQMLTANRPRTASVRITLRVLPRTKHRHGPILTVNTHTRRCWREFSASCTVRTRTSRGGKRSV